MASSSYKKFSPTTNSSDKAALDALATQYGGTANYARGVVEYKVKGNGTSATRSIGLGETPNLAAHARETDNAIDPANNRAQNAVRSGTTIPDIGSYTPITSSTLTPTPTLKFPNPPAPSNLGTQGMTKASGLAEGGAATGTTPPTGPTPAESLQALIDSTKQTPNAEKIYQKTEQEVQLQQKQAAVNNFQNQLNAITAKANADKLSLVGQGRGVTDVIIGGQQAQIDREAAIQALPISAQLAAAQGDLATAQDHLDTLFKIRLQDATNKVDYSNKIATLVYNYATDQQKLALDAKMKADDRAFQLTTNTLNYAQTLATAALNNGQPTLAASIMRLDPNSPSYAKDVAGYAGSISVPKSSGSTGATLEERQANAVSSINSKIVPGAMTPSGLTILNPAGYINPAAWKELIAHAPDIGLTRSSFISNFGNQLYVDKDGKVSSNYGLTPKELKDLGYE